MKIRTNASPVEMYAAARTAGVSFARFDVRGARSHAHGYDVILTGSSNRRANGGWGGAMPSDHAATWDEWGVFLAEVFRADPTTDAGGYYVGAADFHEQTGHRYVAPYDFTPCKNHKWEWSRFGGEAHCAKGCGAVRIMQRVG